MNRLLKLQKQGCNPCTMVQNHLDSKGIQVEKVDVFEEPNIAALYDIATIPVVLLLNEQGEELGRVNGYNPPALDELIAQL